MQNPVIENAPVSASGTYSVTATANGCTSASAMIEVSVLPAPALKSSQNMNLCRGNTAQLLTQGATTYQWTPIDGLSCSSCPDPLANPVKSTVYVVQGRNAIGCKSYDTVTINVI